MKPCADLTRLTRQFLSEHPNWCMGREPELNLCGIRSRYFRDWLRARGVPADNLWGLRLLRVPRSAHPQWRGHTRVNHCVVRAGDCVADLTCRQFGWRRRVMPTSDFARRFEATEVDAFLQGFRLDGRRRKR